MPYHQQNALLEQLENDPEKQVSLEDRELSFRESSRKSCLITANYTIDGHSFKNFITDISTEGASIETGDTFPEGREVMMAFELPDVDTPVSVTGKILWNCHRAMGVKFVDLTSEQENILQSFIDKEI